MDTASFLSHILPKQGIKFIVYRQGADQPWIHKPAEYTSVAADIAQQADATGKVVYHACATFKEPFTLSTTKTYADGRPKKEYRKQANAGWAKSLWLDLDCGPEKDYPSQKAALADIVRFCKEAGFPRPLFVNSGRGVHCYWVFDEAIDAVQWTRIAALWRSVLDFFGVRHDSSRTTDVSSVLRPVGTHNRKEGDAREVRVIGEIPATVPVVELVRRIVALTKKNRIMPAPVPERRAAVPSINSDLSGGMEYPPSSAEQIAEQCAQVRDFRDAKGNVAEPLWYAMLGLLKHTTEGRDVCHDWSSGHPKYDYDDTESKIEQWTHGPTLCTKFEALRPEGCSGCRFAEKVRSPIQLGVVQPESVAIGTEVSEEGVEEDVPEIPGSMSRRFSWDGKRLYIYVRSADDAPELVPFSNMYLYPRQYSRDLDGHMDMTWVLRERPGRYRQFELSGAVTSVGGRDLAAKLGEQGVVCLPGGKKAMEQYITEWFNELRGTVDEVDAFTTFGWHKNGFLLGNTLLKTDGTEVVVRVQGDAERYVPAFAPRGSLEGWVDRVDALYNRPGHEQFQWMMGTGFGAPLVKLLGGGMAGCVVNGYSSESGVGKSTAGMVGLAMYGDPSTLMLAKNQATVRGLFAYIGVMKSLPILLDEVTNTKGYEFSDLVYTFSNGTGRIGAQSDGSLRANVYGWATLMASTSNRAIQSTLAASKINATPEIARVFEYKFSRAVNQMGKLEADELLPQLMENSGHAGRMYLRYVVANQTKVRELLAAVRQMLTKKLRMSQEERFWLAGATTVVAGLMIAKKLNLIQFDINALVAWALRQVDSMRALVGETETDVIDQFGVMLNQLSTGFLVTDHEGDARSHESRAQVLHPPRGDLTGRVIKSSQTLYLPVSVVRRWCSENQADYREMAQELALRQWASIDTKLISLGKGTSDYATAPSRCYKVNLNLAGGEMYLDPQGESTALRVVK